MKKFPYHCKGKVIYSLQNPATGEMVTICPCGAYWNIKMPISIDAFVKLTRLQPELPPDGNAHDPEAPDYIRNFQRLETE